MYTVNRSICSVRALLFALLVVPLAFSGCSLFPSKTGVNSGTVTAETAILKDIQASVTDLQAKDAARAVAQITLNTQRDQVGQFVVDRAAEALFVAQNGLDQTPITALITAQLNPAITALGYKPSPEVKDREIADLQLAQSKSASDIATLKVRNDALATQAGQLAAATITLTTQVAAKEADLKVAGTTMAAKVSDLAIATNQASISAAQAKVDHDQAQKDAAAKERLATARWFMLTGGALFALGIIGLFIHIPDAWAASAAGVALLGMGWAVSYVEDLLQQKWFVYTLDSLVVLGLGTGVWFVFRAIQHHAKITNTSTALDNLVGAIQQASTTNPGLAAELAPALQQWHVNAAGGADQGVIATINAAAVKVNAVNTGQPAVATGIVQAPPATPVVVAPAPMIAATVTSVPVTVIPSTPTPVAHS